MLNILKGSLALLMLSFGQTLSAQMSVTERKVFIQPRNALALRDETFGEKGDKQTAFFEEGGLGIWPFGEPRLNVESKVYTLRVFGTPSVHTDPQGNRIEEERIAFEFSVNTYIVDGIGSQIRAIKEYALSKKGSPLSLGFPVYYWNTKKGDVRQFWLGGQPYLTGRFLPFSDTEGDLEVNGLVGAGYTQQINIDFDLDQSPGALFIEVTGTANLLIGGGVQDAIYAATASARNLLFGLDYRIGYKFGKDHPKSFSITGTQALKDIRGANGLVNFVFASAFR